MTVRVLSRNDVRLYRSAFQPGRRGGRVHESAPCRARRPPAAVRLAHGHQRGEGGLPQDFNRYVGWLQYAAYAGRRTRQLRARAALPARCAAGARRDVRGACRRTRLHAAARPRPHPQVGPRNPQCCRRSEPDYAARHEIPPRPALAPPPRRGRRAAGRARRLARCDRTRHAAADAGPDRRPVLPGCSIRVWISWVAFMVVLRGFCLKTPFVVWQNAKSTTEIKIIRRHKLVRI